MGRGLPLTKKALRWEQGGLGLGSPAVETHPDGLGSGCRGQAPPLAPPRADPATPSGWELAVSREAALERRGGEGGSAHTVSSHQDLSPAHKQSKLGIKTSLILTRGQAIFQMLRKTPSRPAPSLCASQRDCSAGWPHTPMSSLTGRRPRALDGPRPPWGQGPGLGGRRTNAPGNQHWPA